MSTWWDWSGVKESTSKIASFSVKFWGAGVGSGSGSFGQRAVSAAIQQTQLEHSSYIPLAKSIADIAGTKILAAPILNARLLECTVHLGTEGLILWVSKGLEEGTW